MIGLDAYCGRRALVTGGLGFVGSNLAVALSALGAQVSVVDACVPGCGADEANLLDAPRPIRIIRANLADPSEFASEIAHADVIFNLAGEISHSRSMEDPLRDLELNTIAQLKFLTAVSSLRRGVRIVYAGTRQIYGPVAQLPVAEDVPINPTDFNGVHKRAAEQYHLMLARMGRLDAIVLRLTNTYGPRLSLHAQGQGFLSVFFKRLLAGQDLEIFGDGSQIRDPIFANDVVNAFLLAGVVPRPPHRTYNIGGPESLTLTQIATLLRDEISPRSNLSYRPFPADHLAFDIGSYISDSRLIQRDLNWRPTVPFHIGIRLTLAWFLHEAARA